MGNKDAASWLQTIVCVQKNTYSDWIDSFIDLTFFYTELFYYLYLISTVCLYVEYVWCYIFYVIHLYEPKCLTQVILHIFRNGKKNNKICLLSNFYCLKFYQNIAECIKVYLQFFFINKFIFNGRLRRGGKNKIKLFIQFKTKYFSLSFFLYYKGNDNFFSFIFVFLNTNVPVGIWSQELMGLLDLCIIIYFENIRSFGLRKCSEIIGMMSS